MRIALPISLLLTVGCTGLEGDAKDDSFGGKHAKNDGAYSSCQLAEGLKLVNESTSTADKLGEYGLADDGAKATVKYPGGPEGPAGTGDDDVFDALDELDRVDYVGNLALGKLVYAVIPR